MLCQSQFTSVELELSSSYPNLEMVLFSPTNQREQAENWNIIQWQWEASRMCRQRQGLCVLIVKYEQLSSERPWILCTVIFCNSKKWLTQHELYGIRAAWNQEKPIHEKE